MCAHFGDKDGVNGVLQDKNNKIPITVDEAYRIAARGGKADLVEVLQSRACKWDDPLRLAVENEHLDFVRRVCQNLEGKNQAWALSQAIRDAATFGKPTILLSILDLCSIPFMAVYSALEDTEQRQAGYTNVVSILKKATRAL
ncbi:hypothetical protein B0O99DRAFT_694721 [Bisporella sp. PMI_857]|nr:hypothetical protein B0O99DRAFT_694721 [Bisporella sp. PMI_857]